MQYNETDCYFQRGFDSSFVIKAGKFLVFVLICNVMLVSNDFFAGVIFLGKLV